MRSSIKNLKNNIFGISLCHREDLLNNHEAKQSNKDKRNYRESTNADLHNDKIHSRFAFYAMKCIYFTTKKHARHWIENVAKIPIPMLEMQHKITEILYRLINDLNDAILSQNKGRTITKEITRIVV